MVFEQFVYVGNWQNFLLVTNVHHDLGILDFRFFGVYGFMLYLCWHESKFVNLTLSLAKATEILGSTSPLNLEPLRYLSQRWFSPQALKPRLRSALTLSEAEGLTFPLRTR